MKKKTITVDGTYITLVPMGKEDYISLTDIDQRFEGEGRLIENWLRNQNTIEYRQCGAGFRSRSDGKVNRALPYTFWYAFSYAYKGTK